MVWTWAEIIAEALVRSGLLGIGQVPNADLSARGLKALNLLLDEWDGKGLALPDFSTNITFNTVANQAQYLLGPGVSYAFAVRPETIITATCSVTTAPVTNITLSEISYPAYTMIPVPSISGQPWNYAVNETWPQMQVYLYPTPSAVYPMNLACKVKWTATTGQPSLNPFAEVEVPSGYVTALVDNLALKLAESVRMETPTLRNKAANGRQQVELAVYNQQTQGNQTPVGLFSWNILTSGRNPWQ
jgi:hypothetical protein